MKLSLKLAACWLAYFLSLLFFAWLIRILHISMQGAPGHSTAQAQFLLSLLGGVVLVAGLFPLARQLTGSALQRMVALAVFLFLAMGVNTLAETSIFTDLFEGNGHGMVFFYQSLTLFLACRWGFLLAVPVQRTAFLAETSLPGWAEERQLGWCGRSFTCSSECWSRPS